MTVAEPTPTGPAVRLALIGLHLPYLVVPVVYVAVDGSDVGSEPRLWVLALPVAVAAVSLQLHHSLAVAAGRKPIAWPVTFGALLILCAGPAAWFGVNWQGTFLLVVASAFLLLPRTAAVVTGISVLAVNLAWSLTTVQLDRWTQVVYFVAYISLTVPGFGLAIPVAVAGVRALREAEEARLELADQVIVAERTRVARDLHDLVGQSLAAVSLKGDLALRLLTDQPAAAREEIAGLTDLARTPLHGVRDVARHRPAVSLSAELDSARALLTAAGVAVDVHTSLEWLPKDVEEVLAWVVREGATNVLRHSDATVTTITIEASDEGAVLTVENDGARGKLNSQSGLRGLADRAAAVGGRLHVERDEGSFTLRVELPGRAT